MKRLILRCIRWRGEYLVLGKNTAMRIMMSKAEDIYVYN